MSTSEGTRRGLSENGMSMLHLQTSGFQLIGLLFYVDIPSNVSEGIELDFFFLHSLCWHLFNFSKYTVHTEGSMNKLDTGLGKSF
jgi:hypothetical protein